MAESIDELKIEVEAEAGRASRTIDELSDELKSLQRSIDVLDVSKLNELKTSLQDIGNIKFGSSQKEIQKLDNAISKVTSDISKELTNNLVDAFNITDKKVQSSVSRISNEFAKLNQKNIFEDSDESIIALSKSMDELESSISRGARGSVDDAYKDFYEYWRNLDPIYISDKVINDINRDNWNDLIRGTSDAGNTIGKFTNDVSKMQNSVDSLYREMQEKYPSIFPQSDSYSTEQEEVENIVAALKEYRRQLNDTGDVAQRVREILNQTNEAMQEGYASVLGAESSSMSSLQSAYSGRVNATGSEQFSDQVQIITELTNALRNIPKDDRIANLIDQLESFGAAVNGLSNISEVADGISKLVEVTANFPKKDAFKEFADSLRLLNDSADYKNIDSIANYLDRLSESMAAFSSSRVYNVNLNTEQFTPKGDDVDNVNKYTEATERMANATNEARDAIQGENEALNESGATTISAPALTGVTTAQDTANIESAVRAEEGFTGAAQKTADTLEKVNSASSRTGSESERSGSIASAAFRRLESALKGVLSGNSNVLSATEKLASAFGRAGSSAFSLEKNALSAGKSLASMTLQMTPLSKLPSSFDKISKSCESLNGKLSRSVHLFTMMAMRSAFRSVMDELGTSFEHLAQKCDDVNARYSSLISSMSQLSHSIAALAKPLLDIFGPALEYIINLLNTAISYINQFLSALTGKTYVSSKNVATDYAASLDDAASSASKAADAQEELNKQLQSFNELNNLTTNEDNGSGGSGGSGGAGGLEDCYEELAINQKILDLVEQLKDLLATLFEPMKSAWDKYGQGVIDSMKYAISSIGKLIKDMGETWVEVWTNGSGEELCSNILILLTSMFNWIGDIAVAWDEAWNTKGEAYVQSIFDLLNAVLSTIIDISETFREAFNDGSGREMIESIYQILTNSNNIIKDMTLSFKAAWDEEGRGETIAQALFSAINSILNVIIRVQDAWSAVWNNGTGTKLCEQILDLILLVEQAVDSVAVAFTSAWQNCNRGNAFIQSILDLFSSILSIIGDIGTSLLTVWNNGSGEEIIGNILSIFTNINEAVTNLATNFDNAWTHAGAGSEIIQGLADIANTLLEHVNKIFENFKAWTKDLDFEPLITSFNNIVEAVKPLADNVGEGLEWFFKNVLEPIGKWVIESVVPDVLNLVAAAIEAIDTAVSAAKKPLSWFWEDFLQPLGKFVGDGIVTLLENIGGALSGLCDVFNGDIGVFDWIKNVFTGAYSNSEEFEVELSRGAWDDEAQKAIDSDGKTLKTEVSTDIETSSSSDDTAVAAIDSGESGRGFSSHVSTEISKSSSSDDTAVKAVESDGKSLGTTIKTAVEKVGNGVSDAWHAIQACYEDSQAKIQANLEKGTWSDDAWTVLEAGTAQNKLQAETDVKLVKSGWDTITGWFSDKFGSLFGGSSSDESITVKVKLDKKGSDKVSDILDDTQDVTIKLSNNSEKLSKVLDEEFTTKIKISKNSEKLSSWLDETFTTKVKISNQSDKLSSILDETFTTKVKLSKSGWDSFKDWLGGTDVDAKVSLTPGASSLWKTFKKDWDSASGTVDFSADVKNESADWWKHTQNYWKAKVGTADEFKTDVADGSSTWWKNTQNYWKAKVGSVSSFQTDVKNESSTWWSNTKNYWKEKVGTVSNFQTNVKNDSSTWWNDVKTYWNDKTASKYVTAYVRATVDTAYNWWSSVSDKIKSKIGTVYAAVRGKVDTAYNWWSNVSTSVKNKIGTVYASVRGKVDYSYNWWTSVKNGISNAIGTVTVGVTGTYRAKGGVYQNGSWADIPQYAGGTVSAGSLFVAGEAGAELVGHIGGRTEVLNESQLAAVMESSVLEGVASLGDYLNSLYKHITVCTNGIIGAIAVNYSQPQVMPETIGFTNGNNSSAKEDEYEHDMSSIIDLLGQIADNTDYVEDVRSDPNGLFTIMRQKNNEYRRSTGKSAFN